MTSRYEPSEWIAEGDKNYVRRWPNGALAARAWSSTGRYWFSAAQLTDGRRTPDGDLPDSSSLVEAMAAADTWLGAAR